MNFCLQTVSSFGNEALQLFCLEPCPQTHRQSPGQDTQHPLQPPPHPPHHHHHHHSGQRHATVRSTSIIPVIMPILVRGE